MKLLFFFERCLNKLVHNTSWYKITLFGGASKFWNIKTFNLKVVNLGSGAGEYDFNYNGLPILASNWALGPQSLLHDFAILKNYFSYISEGGYVIITICPFSGLFSMYDKKHNFKYYTFLHPATIDNFDEQERIEALKYKMDPSHYYLLQCVASFPQELLYMAKKLVKNDKCRDFPKSAECIVNSWKKQFAIQDFNAPPAKEKCEQILSRNKTLKEMVSFCKERDLKPVIVIPVMHSSLTGYFSRDFQSYYIDTLLTGIKAPIYNYMQNPISNVDEFFYTPLFLNRKGAQTFTKLVMKDLRLI